MFFKIIFLDIFQEYLKSFKKHRKYILDYTNVISSATEDFV